MAMRADAQVRSQTRCEIELEASVQDQIVARHAGDVDLVIALGMHLAEGVFVQEVVR